MRDPSATDLFRAVEAEFAVVARFLEHSGFVECGLDADQLVRRRFSGLNYFTTLVF